MVTRRSASGSGDLSTEEGLRQSMAELEREIEELRGKLAHQQAVDGDLLSDAAHAIRSPLTVTRSYLEILHTDLSGGLSEEQLSFIAIAYDNVIKLSRLVEDLVDLAALETGTAQLDSKTTRIDAVLDSAATASLPAAEERGLELTAVVADGLPEIVVDESRLEDVVRRLIDNAIRFTSRGGSVRIRTAHDQNHVVLRVEDTGVGLPADGIDDAFRPFVQLHRKSGESRENYGLGLALCRRQIEAFGGSLELESDEGKGTTATIRIPCAPIEKF